MNKRPLLPALTGIRFFAAFHVVLFHYTQTLSVPLPFPLARIVRYGYIGVSLFFVLSGFVLAYNFLEISSWDERKRFWKARFARIYPIYFVSLVLCLPMLASGMKDFPSAFSFVKMIGKFSVEATLIQSWSPWTVGVINIPGWSLSTEAFFYLLFPFLIVALRNMQNWQLIMLVLLSWVASLCIPAIYVATRDSLEITNKNVLYVVIYTPLLHLPQFIIGMAGGVLFLHRKQNSETNSGYANIVIIPIILILTLFMFVDIEYPLINNGLLAPLFLLIFYVFAQNNDYISKALSFRPLVVLGEASYAIYILQAPIAGWFLFIKEGTWRGHFRSFTTLSVYIIILIGLSILSFLFFETPARHLILRRVSASQITEKIRNLTLGRWSRKTRQRANA